MMTLEELEKRREERGLEIAHKESQVKQVEENCYIVLSNQETASTLFSRLTKNGFVSVQITSSAT
jgi:hypothetical protein